MNTWIDLYRQHQAVRQPDRNWTQAVRARLTKLAAAGYCDRSVSQRFSNKRSRGIEEWSIRTPQTTGGELLVNVEGLKEATLSVLATQARDGALHQFDVRAEGERCDGTRWVIAVHLSDNRGPEGDRHALGAGGHSVLHCHIGPDLNAKPKIRVPLPALGLVEALDWVLSQLFTSIDFEPAPWADVRALLERETP